MTFKMLELSESAQSIESDYVHHKIETSDSMALQGIQK